MAGYVSRSDARKQQDQCLRKASTLRSRIQTGATKQELVKAAEEVRHAQLQIIKGLLYELEPARTEDCTAELSVRIAKLQTKAEEWKRFSVEEIIRLHSNPGTDN